MRLFFKSLSILLITLFFTLKSYGQHQSNSENFLKDWTLANSLSEKSTANDLVFIYNDSLSSEYINGKRRIIIALPPSYFNSSKKKYPVLYLMDGQNLFDANTSFAGEWNADYSLENAQSDIIIVGIDNGGEERINDYTPRSHEKYGGGNGGNYLKFINQEVKPLIDNKLRTKPERDYTYIGGSSLGGLISLYAIINHEEQYSKGIIFSPSIWFDEEIMEELKNWRPEKQVDIFMLVGGKEGETMVPDTEKAYEILKQKENVTASHITDPEGEHKEIFWNKYFEQALEFLK
ncbi:alpha/beta hydrolase-fold protein [Mangrovivirga sp. M17]|uniref:Alpha/beta hydrolase-fold protein n=1 Tax=Mangrovivirga halotolerans TaxID=2993936 RepID=A0ABT3RVV1_9BACT|nr:alpha/beta hydrolase-fold protein [Mangrovivirga halotolerans]MCX2745656.1 alpha/beta hydrolase-fold protein [Mangrovivirga halotolerans]